MRLTTRSTSVAKRVARRYTVRVCASDRRAKLKTDPYDLSPDTSRLQRGDFQFSLKRLLIVTTLCSCYYAIGFPTIFGTPGWFIVALVALSVLFNDWSVRHLRVGMKALNEGDHEVAIAEFTAAIKAKPGDAQRYYLRGLARYHCGAMDAAFDDFTRAIDLRPEKCPAYYSRGMLSFDQRDYPAAIRDFEAAIAAGASDCQIYIALSYARFRMGVPAEAIRILQRQLVAQPRSAEVLCALAWFLSTSPDDTVRDGQQAMDLLELVKDPEGPILWQYERSLAAAFAEQRDFAEAIRHADAALALSPPNRKTEAKSHLEMVCAHTPIRDAPCD